MTTKAKLGAAIFERVGTFKFSDEQAIEMLEAVFYFLETRAILQGKDPDAEVDRLVNQVRRKSDTNE